MTILPDLTRRCPVVDPDDHHLYTSLGCAAENLLLAAEAMGFHGEPIFSAAEQQSLTIPLSASAPRRSALFEAIPRRQSTRCEYDGKPLSNDELKQLERAAAGEGVRVILLTGSAAIENVLDFVVQANNIQIRDPAYVQELKGWIRFNERQAAQTADGLYAATSGNPALPRWLGSRMFDLFFTPDAENDRYARQIRSSAGIAVFVSERALPAQWIDVGRAFQRFALQATTMGIRTAHLNQAVELASLRRLFAESLGITNARPDLVVRFGRGPTMPRSLRRPVEAVLV
jgi:nitroreductase